MSAASTAHVRALERELPWLRSLARRLATQDADDLVHETWMRAHAADPPERGRLRPWLGAILRNSLRMQRRAARARTQREHLHTPPEPRLLESTVAARQLYALLDTMLEELDAEDRQLLRQRFLEERSAVEIAAERGIPAATVRTRLRRALARLRGRLDERYGGRRAWAAAAVTTRIPTMGLVLTMKAAIGGLLVCTAAVLFWNVTRAERPKQEAVSHATPREPGAVNASVGVRPWEAEPTWVERVRARDALRTRVRAALSESPPEAAVTPEEQRPALSMANHVGQAVAGCSDLLEPEDHGRVTLAFHYLGAPGVGAVVDAVEVEGNGLGREAFTACLTASATLAELDAVPNAVEGRFRAHYTVGEPVDNLRAFLAANPELADDFDAFAQLRDREQTDDALATALATTIASDPALIERFEQWIVDDGLELALVHPG